MPRAVKTRTRGTGSRRLAAQLRVGRFSVKCLPACECSSTPEDIFPSPNSIVPGWPLKRAAKVTKVLYIGNCDAGEPPNDWIRSIAAGIQLLIKSLYSIQMAGLSPGRGSWRQDRWPTLRGDGLRRGTAGQNTRCEVSTIRAANSSSNREGDPHTGSHLVPVPVAEMADDGQLRAVCRQHVRPEIRLGAKTG